MAKKIILTVFKSIRYYPFDVTEDIINNFKKNNIPEKEIITLILPCEYLGAFEILSKIIDEEKPDAIISIGLYKNAEGVEIETFFRNFMKGEFPDASGYSPNGTKINLEKNSQEFLAPQVNTYFLANKLYQENIPVKPSTDPNSFVSNSLGYRTTKKILDEHLPIRNMFIHIPYTDRHKNEVGDSSKFLFKEDTLYRAIELMLLNIC